MRDRAKRGRVRQLAAVDVWLAEMDREYGPVPAKTLAWVERILDTWEIRRRRQRTRERA